MDRLNFSQVYFWLGILGGKIRLTKNKELLKTVSKLEKELDHALGYDEPYLKEDACPECNTPLKVNKYGLDEEAECKDCGYTGTTKKFRPETI